MVALRLGERSEQSSAAWVSDTGWTELDAKERRLLGARNHALPMEQSLDLVDGDAHVVMYD
jgi:hypothetical protein